MNKELKLIRIRKTENCGAIGALYQLAEKTKDKKLIKQINYILEVRRKSKKTIKTLKK
uniref:Uncharacterized protein n=1 Tax=viral metagenome TaxID=1070528 RepID=A0A6H1ZID7_9ZZZZ